MVGKTVLLFMVELSKSWSLSFSLVIEPECTALPPLTLQLHGPFPALWLIFQGTIISYDAPHAGHPSALPACGMVVDA